MPKRGGNMDKLEFQKLPSKGSVTFTLRIPKDINEKLENLSKKTGISKNAIVNKMILFGLENSEIKE